MYFNSMFHPSQWDDSAGYAIFDDFDDWSKFYQYKQFLGGQENFIITGKYVKPFPVRWGRPSIVLSNIDPRRNWDMDWCDKNVVFKIVQNKLY